MRKKISTRDQSRINRVNSEIVTIPLPPWEKKSISAFDRVELNWLTERLHSAQNEAWSTNPRRGAREELDISRKELNCFKQKLRNNGYEV